MGLFGSATCGFVLAHAVAGALDIHYVAPMYQTIQHRRRHDFVADHAAPLFEAFVGRQIIEPRSCHAFTSWKNRRPPSSDSGR